MTSQFAQTQMNTAAQALDELAEEYVSCIEILEDTPQERLAPEDAVELRTRISAIAQYFRTIGSDVRLYAGV